MSFHPQTQRDKAKIQERRDAVGMAFEPMSKALAGYSKVALRHEATVFCEAQDKKKMSIPSLDRIDLRSRESLICWFCAYHREVLCGEFVADLTPFMKRPGPVRSHKRRSANLRLPPANTNGDSSQDESSEDTKSDDNLQDQTNRRELQDSEWYDFPPDDPQKSSEL
jgi:hypothetical protein